MLQERLDAPISPTLLKPETPNTDKRPIVTYKNQFVYDWASRDTHHIRLIDAAKESSFIDFMHQIKTPVRKRLPEFIHNPVPMMDYLTGNKSTVRSYSTVSSKVYKPANCDLKKLADGSQIQRYQSWKRQAIHLPSITPSKFSDVTSDFQNTKRSNTT